MRELYEAAVRLAGRGWPVLPVKPQGKEPLTRHGVTDATTNPTKIEAWWRKWPEANVGVACGAPGPTVLDVDQPVQARAILDRLEPLQAPTAATARGRHLYFAGLEQGTITLDYGELRGRGSYVIAPPSAHPTGKLYTWLLSPNGHLPAIPGHLIPAGASTAGKGTFDAPSDPVPHGGRHDFLKDIAVRAVRSGITDPPTLILIIKAAYEQHCIQTPKAKPDEFAKLAEWASRTDIAGRERMFPPTADTDPDGEPGKKEKKKELDHPPGAHATLAELKAYITLAGGWNPRIDVQAVNRPDSRLTSRLTISLSNGQRIIFAQQAQITSRGHWPRTVIAATNGAASPRNLTDTQQLHVYRCLCQLADAPAETREREETVDVLADLLSEVEIEQPRQTAEVNPTWWYWAISICRARTKYDPRNTETHPVLLDAPDGSRYIRAGELSDYLRHRGIDVGSGAELEGRLADAGCTRQMVNGREPPRADDKRRITNHMVVYRMPDEL